MHCNRGVSRSATFVVAHLMKSRALDPASALELVRALRPQAEPNAAFLKQLDVLHAELEASRKRDAQRMGGPVAPAKPPAPRPVAGPARPERAGPAPRPIATAPARPERAIGAPPRPGADDDGRAEAFAAALERVAAAAPAVGPEKRPAPGAPLGPLPKKPK